MIVDTSAMVAILLEEAGGDELLERLIRAGQPLRISAGTRIELSAVLFRTSGAELEARGDRLLASLGVTTEAVTEEHAQIVRQAYPLYGRGMGNPVRLNIGDCFAYALAKATGEPLLYKGDAFVHTDIAAA